MDLFTCNILNMPKWLYIISKKCHLKIGQFRHQMKKLNINKILSKLLFLFKHKNINH